MSDTENNNNHDKLDDTRPASPLRFGRKRPASADLEGDIIEENHDSMHFKRRHPSAEVLSERNSFDYLPHNMSGISAAQHASADYDADLPDRLPADRSADRISSGQRSESPSTIKEELSLRDITMLRNPDSEHDSRRSDIKRENY